MKEYELLRAEVLDSYKTRTQTMAYGLTTNTLIMAASATLISNHNEFAAIFLLFFVLPPFNTIILLMWLGELECVQRIGNHLLKVENSVNLLLRDKTLTWENGLRKEPATRFCSHLWPVLFFCIIGLSPNFFIDQMPHYKRTYSILGFILIFGFIIFGAIKLIKYLKNSNVQRRAVNNN